LDTEDLYYYRARCYDPTTQRFLSQDPIGFSSGDFNFYRYVGNSVTNLRDPMGLTATCPSSPQVPRNNSNLWVPYYGNPYWFHCGYEGYLENRDPTPDNPIAECFYDEKDNLVDENHKYPKCGGTPDQYGKDSPFLHAVWDDGGILFAGLPAFIESQRWQSANRERLREQVREALK